MIRPYTKHFPNEGVYMFFESIATKTLGEMASLEIKASYITDDGRDITEEEALRLLLEGYKEIMQNGGE